MLKLVKRITEDDLEKSPEQIKKKGKRKKARKSRMTTSLKNGIKEMVTKKKTDEIKSTDGGCCGHSSSEEVSPRKMSPRKTIIN